MSHICLFLKTARERFLTKVSSKVQADGKKYIKEMNSSRISCSVEQVRYPGVPDGEKGGSP